MFSNWTTVWDDEQKNPYKYDGDQWLSYDDERSIREKVKENIQIDFNYNHKNNLISRQNTSNPMVWVVQ